MRVKFKLLSKLILATSMLLGLISMDSRTNVSFAFDQSYFVDIDSGYSIARSDSGKEPKQFPGLEYVRTEVETAGSMVMHRHYYKRSSSGAQEPQTTRAQQTASPANQVTYFVDENGGTIYRKEGLLPPEEIEGYEFLDSFVDAQKGGASHRYRKVGNAKPQTTQITQTIQTTKKNTTTSKKESISTKKSTVINLKDLEDKNFSSIVGSYKAKNGMVYKFNSDGSFELDGQKYTVYEIYRTMSTKYRTNTVSIAYIKEGKIDKSRDQLIEFFTDRIEHVFDGVDPVVITEPGMEKLELSASVSKTESNVAKNNATQDTEGDGIMYLLGFFGVGSLIYIGIRK